MDSKPDFERHFEELISSIMQGPSELPQTDLDNQLQDAWESAEAEEHWDHFDEAWEERAQPPPSDLIKGQKFMPLSEFCSMWQSMWPMEELQQGDYIFEPNNPFLNNPNSQLIAQESLAHGEINQSILALESVAISNPELAEIWVLLGKLNAESDEDSRAVAALTRAYNLDSYNLEAILSLGISLINGKQEQNAMEMLIKWIEHNPNYNHLSSSSTEIYDKVLDLYTQASMLHPEDHSLFQVIGSLYFMSKDYDLAVSAFTNAVDKDHDNYYCWNRLGAALAHSGDNQNAIHAYQRALEIRPQYVRAWANLGIAHANIGNMVEAIRYYLCALSFNNKASHIWNYLFTSFACLSNFYIGRFDLLEKLKAFDPQVFEDEFQYMALRNFPLQQNNEWANEFLFENN